METHDQISKGMGNMFVYASLASVGAITLLLPSMTALPVVEGLATALSDLTQTCWPKSAQMILGLGALGVVLSFLVLLPATLWARRNIGLKRSRRFVTVVPLALATIAVLCATAAQLSAAHAAALHCDGRLMQAAFFAAPNQSDVWLLWMTTSSRLAAATIAATAALIVVYPRKWKRYG